MLKQCTAILLLLAFAASTFRKAVIVADFYANQDYIAKNLCENRGNPLLHCCGRCKLKKRLAREDNQDQNNPERRAENKEVLFVEGAEVSLNTPFVLSVLVPYGAFVGHAPIDQPDNIDHPPA
jgi:hypothetical protein